MADNQELCSCLDNKAQIDSVVSNQEQISSQINQSEQIKSDMSSLLTVSRSYSSGDSDNIDLDIDNNKNIITANIKQVQFDSANDFPKTGSEKLIYVDKLNNNLYRWDADTQQYILISNSVEIVVDDKLSDTSENPVQNKVITKEVNDILLNNKQIAKDYENAFGIEWNAGFLAGNSKSTGNWSIGIGADSEAGQLGISIGNRAKSNNGSDVIIGTNARRTDRTSPNGYGSTAIGSGSKVSGINNIALGSQAEVNVDASSNPTVQLGSGTNTNNGSLQFRNYTVVENDGKIPNERLPIDEELSADSSNAIQNKTVTEKFSTKQDTLIAGSGITIAEDGKTISATITLDTKMSDTSTNAVQNKVIKEYVDTGLDGKASLAEENVYSGKQTYNGELEINSGTTHTKDVSLENSVIKVLDTTNDAVTTYGSKEITIEQNGAVITHKLSLPDKSGTLITDSDFNTKHSKIQNADTDTESVDEWRLSDTDAKIRLVSLVENDETEITLERNYTALKHAGAAGAGEVSISANNVVMESKDLDGNVKNLTISPTKATINNKEIITEVGGTFENRPKIKENGTTIDVATKSDLENYLEKQSDKDGVYAQITNQDGQVSVNISENGDTQTFIINKNGATLNGSNLLTSAGGTITGDVNIQGNVTVTGETTIEKTKNLEVENAIIYTNANKIELKTILSGLAIYKDGEKIYGIMYDPATDSVKLGLGTVDAEGKFIFNSGEGKPVAVRSDSSLLVDGHLIKWDSATNSFVDSGKEVSEDVVANSIAERTVGGALKSTPITNIDIENQTDDTVATKKDIKNSVKTTDLKDYVYSVSADDAWLYNASTKKLGGSGGSVNNTYDPLKGSTTDFGTLARVDQVSHIATAHNDLVDIVNNKQEKLTAGGNISISNNTISAVDTKYTAGEGIEISADNVISATGGGPNVVQTTGQSETDVMSQKATTDALSNKITKNVLDIYVGTNDTCSDADGNFGQCSQIYKTDGTSYAVRQFLFNKNDFQQEGTNDKTKYSLATDILRTSNISQETGNSTDKIMSQDSVTKELAKTVKKTDIVDNLTSTDSTVPLSANQGKVLDDKNTATNQQLVLLKSTVTNLTNNKVNKTVTVSGHTAEIDMLESGGQLSLNCSDGINTNVLDISPYRTRSFQPLYVGNETANNKVVLKSELAGYLLSSDANEMFMKAPNAISDTVLTKNSTFTPEKNGYIIARATANDKNGAYFRIRVGSSDGGIVCGTLGSTGKSLGYNSAPSMICPVAKGETYYLEASASYYTFHFSSRI